MHGPETSRSPVPNVVLILAIASSLWVGIYLSASGLWPRRPAAPSAPGGNQDHAARQRTGTVASEIDQARQGRQAQAQRLVAPLPGVAHLCGQYDVLTGDQRLRREVAPTRPTSAALALPCLGTHCRSGPPLEQDAASRRRLAPSGLVCSFSSAGSWRRLSSRCASVASLLGLLEQLVDALPGDASANPLPLLPGQVRGRIPVLQALREPIGAALAYLIGSVGSAGF
jgi:hypothetical protein